MTPMSPSRKRMAIGIIVVGSVLIGVRVIELMSGEVELVDPVTKPAKRSDGPPEASALSRSDRMQMPSLQLDRLVSHQRELADRTRDPDPSAASGFAPVSWSSPLSMKAQVVADPPPAPVAPPFPYAYVGGLSDEGVQTAFFSQGGHVLPVKAGDTVDAVYRIDQMTETLMTLTYLPLNQSLSVALGSRR